MTISNYTVARIPSAGRELARTMWLTARWRLVRAVALALAAALTSGITVVALMSLVLSIDAGTSAEPSALLDVARSWLPRAWALEIGLATFVVANVMLSWLNRWQSATSIRLVQEVTRSYRGRLFNALCRTEWVAYVRMRSTDALQTLIAEVDRTAEAARAMLALAGAVCLAIVYTGFAVGISGSMTAVTLAGGIVLTVLLGGRRRAAGALGEQFTALSQTLYRELAESLTHMKTIRALGIERTRADALDAAERRLAQGLERLSLDETTTRAWFEVGGWAMLAAVAYLGLRVVAIPAGELVVLLFVFVKLMPQLAAVFQSAYRLRVQLPAVRTLIALEASAPAAAPDDVVPARLEVRRHVRFDRVRFDYGNGPIVRDVSLVVPAGRCVAIVGPSGAGKTTLADLLLGLLTPSSGSICVDDEPLTPAHLQAWRQSIGYVSQEPLLFHESIRDNLRTARATASDDDLWQALSAAAADDLVRGLPDGLDTVVGDRGSRLSGGERQRIAIARALLRNPSLLVLDEATSSLDADNDALVAGAIARLKRRAAVVMITHRLSSVRFADFIYVVEAGRRTESGTWLDLVGRPQGRFRALCEAQGIVLEPDTESRKLAVPRLVM